MNSIRLVFPALFAAQILIGASLVMGIALVSQMREARETARDFLNLIGGTVDDQLQAQLAAPLLLTRGYARQIREKRLGAVDDLLAPGFVKAMMESIRVQGLASRSVHLSVSNPAGQNLTLDRRHQSRAVVKLSDARKGGTVTWQTFDSFGTGAEPLELQKIGYDPRNQGFFQQALARQETVIYGIHPSPLAGGALVATVAEPVFDERNRLRAVVSSDIDLQTIGIYLQGLRLPVGAAVFIFDRRGKLVASSRRQGLEERGETGADTLPSALDNLDPAIHVTAEQIHANFGSFDFDAGGTFDFGNAQDRHYVYAVPLSSDSGLGWKLAVVIPEAGLIDNLVKGIQSTAWVSVVLLLVAIAMGLVIARWMIKPIITLSDAASAIEQNRLTEPPLPLAALEQDTRRRNELGQLAQVFLRMIEEVKARHKLLEIQLEQLRVDIDHQETEAQVRQITETAFFRSLKSKANALREARRNGSGPALDDPAGDTVPSKPVSAAGSLLPNDLHLQTDP